MLPPPAEKVSSLFNVLHCRFYITDLPDSVIYSGQYSAFSSSKTRSFGEMLIWQAMASCPTSPPNADAGCLTADTTLIPWSVH